MTSSMQQDPHTDLERAAHPDRVSPDQVHGAQRTYTINPAGNGGSPPDDYSPEESQECDFDDRANNLWSFYGKEAKNFDEATINTFRADMDSLLIFAGLFSAVLTAFLIDRSQTIQPTPAQQSAYFQKQSALLLNQISQQLSSLGAQVSISSNISLSVPAVSASASDVRVNIWWYLSLVSSLSAVLLATLIQRWVRDYMRIFQRYSNPFELARIRQYLHEGVRRWHMSSLAEAAPALVQISLFLFFIGLADFLLNAYTIVGKITLFPIIFSVTVFIICTFAPIIDPQTPYRTPFSSLVWYLTRRLRSRPCKDRFGKHSKPLSSNVADGKMQLAMERNHARRDRDERAIGWLAENLRGNAEMESFTQGIPGSFNTKWGREVWNKPADETVPGTTAPQNDDQLPHSYPPQLDQKQAVPWAADPGNTNELTSGLAVLPLPFATSSPPSPRQRPNVPRVIPPARLDVDGICRRIRHLFEAYENRDNFSDMDEWRKRSRACAETAASFAFCINVDFRSFGEIGKFLSDLGFAEKTNKWSETSLNRSFMMRWTCLSLVATRRMLMTKRVKQCAGVNITLLALYNVDEDSPLDTDGLALSNAREIDTQFKPAWNCIDELYSGLVHLRDTNEAVSEVKTTLLHHKPKLNGIQVNSAGMGLIDTGIQTLQNEIDRVTHRLTRQLPGVELDTLPGPTPLADTYRLTRQLPDIELDTLLGPTPLADIIDFLSNPIVPQFVYLRQRFQGLRAVYQGQDIREVVSKIVEKLITSPRVAVNPQGLMERQLWRFQDLSVGAFGFTLELYFLALRQFPASASSSGEFTTFYMGALKNITSDWEQYKDSPGTHKIILNLICDISVRDRGIFSNYMYPDAITTELVDLLCKMIQGRNSDYIGDAMEELRDVGFRLGNDAFRKKAYEAIAESLAAAL